MQWRVNLHKTIKHIMQWDNIPPIVIDAIDSAYLQGLEDASPRINSEGQNNASKQ